MGRIMNLSLAAVLTAALTLTGACANISNDSTRTKTEGTLAGAGIGAVLGAAIGAALGGRDGALKGAAIGAGVGALSGFAYGTSVANKKADYASEEEWLSACLAETQNTNQQAAAYNSRLKTSLAGYQKGAAAGGTGYSFAGSDQSGKSGKSDQKQVSQAVKRDLKESGEILAYLDQEISSQQQVVASAQSGAQTKQLQKEIAEMEKQKKILEQQNRELAAISNRLAI